MTAEDAAADRRGRALQLRVAGAPVSAIAEQLGVSVATVRRDLARALKDTGRPVTELELERIESAERRVQSVIANAARSGDHDRVLAAADRLVRLGDARARAAASTGISGPVTRALRADLALLKPSVASGPLAQAAKLLAGALDAGMSPRDAASATRELRMTLVALQEMNPGRAEDDPIDELTARREARLTADR